MDALREYDEEMQGTPGTRLRQLSTAAGYREMSKFARAAGIDPGTADKHVQRASIPYHAAEKYIVAARHTGADIEWLLKGKGRAPQPTFATARTQMSVMPQLVTGTAVDSGPSETVRLWTAASHRAPGGHVLVAETNDVVLAPSELRNSKSAFAVQAWDESNSPWVRRGSMLFVDPARIPAFGQWCILASKADDSPSLYRPALGILMGIEEGNWLLQQGSERVRYDSVEWPLTLLVAFIRQA